VPPDPQREDSPGPKDWQADLARYGGLGLTLGVTLAAFSLAGWWLDGQFGTSPLCLLIGTGLGFFGGMVSLIRKVPTVRGKQRK
jgi:hypothetical protein